MKGGALKKQAKTGAKGRPFEKIRRAPLNLGPLCGMMKQNAWKKESTPAPPGQRNCVTG